MGKRIVIATAGSLGDLHPYMAIALELKARGHEAVIATAEYYRTKIEAEEIGFRPIRPNITPDKRIVEAAMDARTGPEYIFNSIAMPHLRESFADFAAAARGADLILSHPLTIAAPLVAEKYGINWASSVLAPLSFFSAYDPPVIGAYPGLAKLYRLGPWFTRVLFGLGRLRVRSWSTPVRALRAELGLLPGGDPIFEGQHSPMLVLALFSSVIAKPQPDWPSQARTTGFAFYDREERDRGMPPELVKFLESGPPPIVFTLGSSAVRIAGDFYAASVEAAKRLGRRAVLLVGTDPANVPPGPLPGDIIACDYAPYSELFPHAAAIVHQGGIGTTAQALRAGRPMLVIPFSHDQPDNAARVTRLGVARAITRPSYTAARAAAELQLLLDDPACAKRAAQIGQRVRAENGARAACDAMDELLARGSPA
jgi:UDP:flavonoid glycosyltransferase YjiC (YdhE family)